MYYLSNKLIHLHNNLPTYDNFDIICIDLFINFFMILFQLQNWIGIAEIIDIEYTIEMFQFTLFYVLQHLETTTIPLHTTKLYNSQINQQVVVYLDLFKTKLESHRWLDVLVKSLFLYNMDSTLVTIYLLKCSWW